MSVVDLAFVAALWPARFLKLGMEIDPGVALGLGHDFAAKVKVFKGGHVAHVKQVAAIAIANKRARLRFSRNLYSR